ncbi:hypothetical protein AB5J62_29915 [Amycolatopsis sp. cg5]|uniref:hypothetical protein n=1 Tax=Amycolatopsis sp. cg5 TaxID=3238802 RepID=UPI00352592C2
MTHDYIRIRMVESFEAFAHKTPTSALVRLSKNELALGNFIVAWLRDGDGVEACCGDFTTYLIGVVAIMDYWRFDPGFLDYIELKPGRDPGSMDRHDDDYVVTERDPKDLFVSDEASPSQLLTDRDFFNACVWKHTQGERSVPVSWNPQ